MATRSIRHRAFFAFRPGSRVSAQISNMVEEIAPGLPRVANEYFHSTLGITNDYKTLPTQIVDDLRSIGDEISADPFDVTVDRLSGSQGSVALRPSRSNPAWRNLQAPIEKAMLRAGALRDGWRFSQHITLYYRSGTPFSQIIGGYDWPVEELLLIHSRIGAGEHRVLGRWPLRGRDDPQLNLF
jgi:2'-5' RNA ligase